MALEVATPDELKYQFNPVSSGSLHFKVRAANDAHIALTSGPEESDPMYEVFIGGWSNSKSVVRRNRTKPDVAEVETPDILSANEFRGFWISWDNGNVSVGKEGQDVSFLNYSDPDPFGIGYYGVCTGWGASGTWLIEGSGNEIATIDGGDCLSYTFHPIRQGSLDIEVRTPSNAHIALTSGPKETDPMYEIMLGGWENTASVIRYRREQPDKVRVDTPNLVNLGEFRRFVVEWEAGRIRVQHKGETLLEWTDPNPIGISYFGIRTGWGASGFWKVQATDLRRRTRVTNTMGWTSPPSISEAFGSSPREGRVDEGEEELKNGSANVEENEENQPAEEQDDSPKDEDEATTQPGWNVPAGGASSGPGTWVDAAGGAVPEGAVPGGFDGEQLYIARASLEGAVIPGKLVPSHGVAYIPWGGAEHGQSEYQVLCGCNPTWVAAKDGEIPPGAFPGGNSEDGEQLFIGRVDHNGTMTIGKVQQSHSVCYIPYAGQEISFPEYEVLVSN